jgi:acyl-CoA synthetase (NDP forming)
MQALDYLFCPKSVAVVGASSNPESRTNQNFLQPLLTLGYPGSIYPVNPQVTEVMGLKAYANVRDIPEPVDYVICAIPASMTPTLIRDCAAARAKVVSLFTAGFSETGEEEGARLEREITEIARRGNVRLIGPNCLGLHCPGSGISLEAEIPRTSGGVSFFSQSGGNAREIILAGAERHIFFNKLVSYGNAADLNEADFLEHFARDKHTTIIGGYVEGIKEPQRFLRALSEATASKPVLLLKGGESDAGTGAVASHTGAVSGSRLTWDALCRQTGVIKVRNLEEMADAILAFSCCKPPRGRRVGLVGIGGGTSVLAADECENAGFTVPPFPPEVRQQLSEFIPSAGTGLRNPLDSAADVYWEPTSFARAVEIVAKWDGVDVVFVMLSATATLRRGLETVRAQLEAILDVGRRVDKPLAIVLRSGNIIKAEYMAREVQGHCIEAGFPVYRCYDRAARATSHLIQYHENASRR